MACLSLVQERVPDKVNMFSDNMRYPSHGYRLKPNKALPRHIDQSFNPEQPRGLHGSDLSHAIEGRERYKFFQRPVVPVIEAVPPHVYVI